MYTTLSSDCPYCWQRNASLVLLAESKVGDFGNGGIWNVMFRCNSCQTPMAAQMLVTEKRAPSSFDGDLSKNPRTQGIKFFSQSLPDEVPEHVPHKVAAAFSEARSTLINKTHNAATAMYRRTLELITKEQAPEKMGTSLYERIEYLAHTGKLTLALRDWTHNLRALGNEALHDMDDITPDEAMQVHELTRFILIYLYTLPKQVEIARALRGDNSQTVHTVPRS